MRELSSIFVAWCVVYLLLLVAPSAAARRPTSASSTGRPRPWVVVLNVVALAFVAAARGHLVQPHAAGDGRAGRRAGRCRPGTIIAGAVRRPRWWSPAFVWLAGDPMTKRRVEPLVWLMFSGGGVAGRGVPAGAGVPVRAGLPARLADRARPRPPARRAAQPADLAGAARAVRADARCTPPTASATRCTTGCRSSAKRTVAVLCYGGALVGSAAAVAVDPARWLILGVSHTTLVGRPVGRASEVAAARPARARSPRTAP